MRKTIFTLLLIMLLISQGHAQKSITGDIWLHMLTTGQPAATKYLGDQLNGSGTWYINFEVGQATWYQTDAGIGLSNTDPSTWTWRTANWYENGLGSNKHVQSDFGDFRFSQTGTWYLNGRAKGEAGDAFHYANTDSWGHATTFSPIYYFTVNALNNPSGQSATPSASSPQINLVWTKDAENHNVMIVRKKSTQAWTEPTQGTTYTAGNTIGSGVVVYNNNGTSCTDDGLASSTAYDYKFYSENFGYYSTGVTCSATTATAAFNSFRSVNNGDWNDVSIWESSNNGTEWFPATEAPTSRANSVVISHIISVIYPEAAANLTLNTGTILTINSTASLEVLGTFINNVGMNGLIIKSDATSSGSLLENSGVAAKVERCFTGNTIDWHLVSSPVAGATANVFYNMFMQSFDEPSNSYSWITDAATPLNVMDGYGLYSNLANVNTVTFAGSLNSGTKTKGYTASNLGWNLMGNPFPSCIDWEMVSIPAGLSNEVHYISANDGNDLSYVKGIGGSGSEFIAPMQGFFVRANTSGTFSLGLAQRSIYGANNFYKSSNPELVVLQASSNNYSDEAWIHFNPLAGEEHDGEYDAYKRISTVSNPQLPQIFSYTPMGVALSVNGMPQTSVVPVGFTSGEASTFTIAAVEKGSFASLVLEDIKTNQFTDLLKGSYTFSFTPGDVEQRFMLHFGFTGMPETLNTESGIYSNQNKVFVDMQNAVKGDINIYNITGQLVSSKPASQGINTFELYNTGNYIVKVITNGSTRVKKVFVQQENK
jgi:hypothetical protein